MKKAGREHVAVEVARGRLSAVRADRVGGRLRVKKALCEDIPAWLDISDLHRVGAWVGDKLQQANLVNGRVLMCLGRELVVLKRLTLPTTDRAELPDMTRLALQRELPFSAAEAVIDFVECGGEESLSHVLAVAAPQSAIENAKALAQAAGLTAGRITLRSMGTAALISQGGTDRSECVLCIDISRGAVDFAVVDRGHIRLSRAAELPVNVEPELVGEAVLMETRRTWMSYRIIEESGGVKRAILLGDPEVVSHIRDALADMLHVPVEAMQSHPKIESESTEISRVWPLLGLLLEPFAETGGGIDFSSPRKAPDRHAALRQRALAVAGIVLVGLLAAWTIGRQSLQSLRGEHAALSAELSRLEPRYETLRRDLYQRDHLRVWESVQVNWLARLEEVAQMSPSPSQLVYDSFVGSLQFSGVSYDDKTQQWSAAGEVSVVIDGEAVERPLADSLRAALVKSDRYRASTTGAERSGGRRMAAGFTYRLLGSAEAAARGAEAPGGSKGGGS